MKLNTTFLCLSIALFSCQSNDNSEKKDPNIKTEIELPLREVTTKEVFINVIKSDSNWLFSVEQKAKDQNKSIEEMLNVDAEFMVVRDAEIVKIENDIIRNPEWLKSVKQKAKDQKISLDEMIKADATFMYEEGQKEKKQ